MQINLLINLTRITLLPAFIWLFGATLNLAYAAKPLQTHTSNEPGAVMLSSADDDQAIKFLEQAVLVDTDNPDVFLKLARQYARRGDAAMGHKLLDNFLLAHMQQPEALNAYVNFRIEHGESGAVMPALSQLKNNRRERITSLIDSGNRPQALQQLAAWAAQPSAVDIALGMHLGEMLSGMGEYTLALKCIDAVLVAHPDKPYLLNDAWKMAERGGLLDQEIIYLKRLVLAESVTKPVTNEQDTPANAGTDLDNPNIDGLGDNLGSPYKIERDWKEKKLAALMDRRTRWFSSAVDVLSRNGTTGLSQFDSIEVPLEFKTPWHSDEEIFFRADLIKLDAGDVAPTYTGFGSMLFCQPNCSAAQLPQAVQGVSYNVGYQRNNFVADIGRTAGGFPVRNFVGGLQVKGDLGKFGYSVIASRRPVTASLLSYAGAHDPNTGQVWGGVVATGVRAGLSLDQGGTFGFWSTLGWHNLTGRNVQLNRRIQLMAGEQWRIINEENRRLVLGVTGIIWNFSENTGEYTFGHGGYYSPNRFRLVSLPVTYARRMPRFSYLLRTAVSAFHAKSQTADFFPTDGSLQSQALLLGATPIYTGGVSNGTGYSLRAAGEYQLTSRLFVGGLLAVDRSQNYAPNQALFYLRYSWDRPGAQPVLIPLEPVEPSSRFN
ncbi:MAG: cellulose synthase subunit BcsC-related outer membrane protein [Candidatus Nitrotoga sp.]